MTEIQENPSILGKEEDPTPPLEKKKGRGGGAGVGSTGMTPELASKLSFRRSGEEQVGGRRGMFFFLVFSDNCYSFFY